MDGELGITVGDYSASVDLQSLLDHTTKRIVMIRGMDEKLKPLEQGTTLRLISKVGFDQILYSRIYGIGVL